MQKLTYFLMLSMCSFYIIGSKKDKSITHFSIRNSQELKEFCQKKMELELEQRDDPENPPSPFKASISPEYIANLTYKAAKITSETKNLIHDIFLAQLKQGQKEHPDEYEQIAQYILQAGETEHIVPINFAKAALSQGPLRKDSFDTIIAERINIEPEFNKIKHDLEDLLWHVVQQELSDKVQENKTLNKQVKKIPKLKLLLGSITAAACLFGTSFATLFFASSCK